MTEPRSQNCVLCASSANYVLVGAAAFKYFNCPQCGYFQISAAAEKALRDDEPTARAGFAAIAKQAPRGKILALVVPPMTLEALKNPRRAQATWIDPTNAV